MKCGTALLLLASLARHALAEFSYNVTATHNGKPIDPSAIKLEPFVPHLHGVNQTTQDASGPPVRPGRTRRMQRALGTGTSANWCGAVAQTTGSTLITKAHGYFQAPTLSARSGVSQFPQYVGEWIGIDGYTNSVILQAGTGHSITSGGVQSNWAWFQWYPSAAYTISSFPVAAGDWIEVTITASSSTAGSITINNLSQSYTYTVNLSGGTALSRNSVEWVVEDPANGSGLLPFASFSTVWFEDVYAQTSSNTYLGVDSSTLISINNGHCIPVEYDNDNFYAYSA